VALAGKNGDSTMASQPAGRVPYEKADGAVVKSHRWEAFGIQTARDAVGVVGFRRMGRVGMKASSWDLHERLFGCLAVDDGRVHPDWKNCSQRPGWWA
jgi:hypothetical protein